MAFLDELKTIEATSKQRAEALSILQLLLKDHERKLLARHLEKVYQRLTDEIREFVNGGDFDGEQGKRELTGAYKMPAFIYTDFNFEPPFPNDINEEKVAFALQYKDELRASSRIKIEPIFVLKNEKRCIFGKTVKHEGIVEFQGNSLWFLEELEKKMNADGIQLRSITAPVAKINRIITLSSYKASVECSYTTSAEQGLVLGYEDSSFVTIRYKLIF